MIFHKCLVKSETFMKNIFRRFNVIFAAKSTSFSESRKKTCNFDS